MQPTFDPATATHVVSETSQQMTLRALGLKTLAEIPQAIPTVKWAWVISGAAVPGERDRREMDYEFMHAAFPSRMDAGRSFTDKGNGKQRADTAYVFLAFFFLPSCVVTLIGCRQVRVQSLRRHARLREVLARRSRWTWKRRSVETSRHGLWRQV